MIPRAYVIEWQHSAPWPGDDQIEQDLILSRILVDIYQNEYLNKQLLFRGGTALNKLFFTDPIRYSEDLDFVQKKSGPIKEIVKTIQGLIDPWLGASSTQPRKDGFRIYYQFIPESDPEGKKRIKIEINTREHFSVFPIKEMNFEVKSQWFTGASQLNTYELTEMLGTKMRALYQRKKGRDLFDINWALKHHSVKYKDIIKSFHKYMEYGGHSVSAAQYFANLENKLDDPIFCKDIDNYKRNDIDYDINNAFENIKGLSESFSECHFFVTYL